MNLCLIVQLLTVVDLNDMVLTCSIANAAAHCKAAQVCLTTGKAGMHLAYFHVSLSPLLGRLPIHISTPPPYTHPSYSLALNAS